MRVPPHVGWIAEAGQLSRRANRQPLRGDELIVCEQTNANDEVLDSREAYLKTLTADCAECHPRPHGQITRATNCPGVPAHSLDEELQRLERRLGSEHELGDAVASGSLDQAEQLVAPSRGEDLHTRSRREIEPLRIDWSVPGNQTQPGAAEQRLQPARIDGGVRVRQIDDDHVPRPDLLCARRGHPMARSDLGFESAAHRGGCAVGWTEQVDGGFVHTTAYSVPPSSRRRVPSTMTSWALDCARHSEEVRASPT